MRTARPPARSKVHRADPSLRSLSSRMRHYRQELVCSGPFVLGLADRGVFRSAGGVGGCLRKRSGVAAYSACVNGHRFLPTNGAGAAVEAASSRDDQGAVGELGFGAGGRAAQAGGARPGAGRAGQPPVLGRPGVGVGGRRRR